MDDFFGWHFYPNEGLKIFRDSKNNNKKIANSMVSLLVILPC